MTHSRRPEAQSEAAVCSASPARVRPGVVALLAALAVSLIAAVVAFAAPLPDPVPRTWEFRFEPGELRVAVIETEDDGPRPFYYMTYYVENNTGSDRYFAPRFELATDSGDLLRSGREVPREAVDSILRLLRNDFLRDEIRVQGPLLQGDDNAREGLVIWPCNDTSIDEVTIFAAGFSGENTIVRRPDNGETVLLRKSKMLRHAVPGDLNLGTDDPLDRTLERWIMR